jgi:hypothetical protein
MYSGEIWHIKTSHRQVKLPSKLLYSDLGRRVKSGKLF